MIDSIYKKYFQKSKSFLYPALGIVKKSKHSPINTYISVEGLYEVAEKKLICVFKKKENDDDYRIFIEEKMKRHILYEKHFEMEKEDVLVFNFSNYEKDWDSFLKGKYSKFTISLKNAIKSYYGDASNEYKFIHTYLFPEKYFELYAKLLNVDVEDIEKVGELCDIYDPTKENLKIPDNVLTLLTKIK